MSDIGDFTIGTAALLSAVGTLAMGLLVGVVRFVVTLVRHRTEGRIRFSIALRSAAAPLACAATGLACLLLVNCVSGQLMPPADLPDWQTPEGIVRLGNLAKQAKERLALLDSIAWTFPTAGLGVAMVVAMWPRLFGPKR